MLGQGLRRSALGFLLGAWTSGFSQSGAPLAGARELDVRLGRRDRHTLPPQSGPSRGVGRDVAVHATTGGLCRAPPRAGNATEPDASALRGASARARAPSGQTQGSEQPAHPLGRAHGFCGASRSGYGQSHRGAPPAQPSGRPQELLWLGQRVERPLGGDGVECDPNRLALGSQSTPLATRLPPSLCGPWRSEPDRPQCIPALADDARTPRSVGLPSTSDVAPLGQPYPTEGRIGSSRYLLMPDPPGRLSPPQPDESMAMPRCRQTGAGSARLPDRVRIPIKRWWSRLPKHSRPNDDAVLAC